MALKKIDLKELSFNPFLKIRDQWALLAAGKEDDWNAMTVNWGGLGELWYKEVTTVYVRPGRYTHKFMEENDFYTLIFLKDGNREALNVYGSKSGRDIDKMSGCGLTPIVADGCPTFAEAELTLVCRKLYKGQIEPEGFLYQETIDRCYPQRDFHTMYVGEVVAAYVNED